MNENLVNFETREQTYKKADIKKLNKEATYDVVGFPPIYINVATEKDSDARDGNHRLRFSLC